MQARLRTLYIALAGIGLVLMASAAAAPAKKPARYVPRDLGALAPAVVGCPEQPSVVGPSAANDVNDRGQVVGRFTYHCDGSFEAFSYSPRRGGGFTRLGRLPGPPVAHLSEATRVNDAGVTVGWSSIRFQAGRLAVEFRGADGPVSLGYLGAPFGDESGIESLALGLNEHGTVVGRSRTSDAGMHGFIRHRGVVYDLGVPPGYERSSAVAVAYAGTVALNAATDQCATPPCEQAFRYGRAGLRPLGTLGGASSAATDISSGGTVVGSSTTADGTTHAFAAAPGRRMVDLGPGVALGVNRRGAVVGYGPGPDPGSTQAFVYLKGRRLVLDRLLPSGWRMHEARAINDDGVIVGVGSSPTRTNTAIVVAPT
jgi:probable HAF family extracellular repeat protein